MQELIIAKDGDLAPVLHMHAAYCPPPCHLEPLGAGLPPTTDKDSEFCHPPDYPVVNAKVAHH